MVAEQPQKLRRPVGFGCEGVTRRQWIEVPASRKVRVCFVVRRDFKRRVPESNGSCPNMKSSSMQKYEYDWSAGIYKICSEVRICCFVEKKLRCQEVIGRWKWTVLSGMQ